MLRLGRRWPTQRQPLIHSSFFFIPPVIPVVLQYILPPRGHVGQTVTIRGQNFLSTTKVYFDGVLASSTLVGSDIQAVVPNIPPGTVDVTLV